MSKNLVIVESPAKAKTIEKYLGDDFTVKATLGHVRDLPKKEMAVDVEHDFEPSYSIIKGKSKVISALKKGIPKSGMVYLAMDPDREGEAIAWHTAFALGLLDEHGTKKHPKSKVDIKRVVFHEITKDAIKEAVDKPRDLDLNLIDAQQARRILDRLVGYTLSPLLWKKIRYGLSAGRVQSVAVRLIVERERERLAFKPEEYWKMIARLKNEKDEIPFELIKKNGKKYQPKSKDDIKEVESRVKKADWIVSDVRRDEVRKYPKPPFTTSTLQQAANNIFGYSAKRTMGIAQQLYQGLDLGKKGHTALITYMRTDSFNLSNQAITGIRSHIEKKIGPNYLPEKPTFYKSRAKNTQEAHEAIRPVDFSLTPEELKDHLEVDFYKLYKMIWDRAVASQMVPAVYDKFSADIEIEGYLFRSVSSLVKFDGFTKVWKRTKTDEGEPINFVDHPVEKGQKLDLKKLDSTQHFTMPPARYTDASLVKMLEKYGIGRPSTYAPIISTILARGYVGREARAFYPEDTGYVVNDLLVKHFPEVVDYDFTAEMENELDDIAEGKLKWVPVIKEFFDPFKKNLDKKQDEIKKEDVVVLEKSDEKCPICGKKMIVKLGRFGRFLSCSDFPKCKGMKAIEDGTKDEEIDLKKYLKPEKCPKCGSEMVLKKGRYGKFWACVNYPTCKGAEPMLLHEKCPECGGHLVERQGKWGKAFIGCSNYPKCKYIKKQSAKDKKKKADEDDSGDQD